MMWCSSTGKKSKCERKSFLNSTSEAYAKTEMHKIICKDKCADIFRNVLSDISEKMNKNVENQWVKYKFQSYRL